MKPFFRFLPICVLFSIACYSSHSQQVSNLVFEGAGVRGIAYVGSLKALENINIMGQIENVGGTSAGAIAALCVALGYNSQELEKIIQDAKIQRFNDGKFFFVGGIARMSRSYGWYRGKSFTKWLEEIIYSKTKNVDITFRELHERGYRNLYVTGTSLNHQKLIVFSFETYPEMKIKDAIRISMSVPLYFEAIFINSTGQIRNNKYLSGYFDVMVDGGLTGNFPISIFDSLTNNSGGMVRISNPKTLGFRIDTPEQVKYDLEGKGLAPISVNGLRQYVSSIYTFALENLNRSELATMDWARTISISSGDIGPKVRRLSREEKDLLIRNGQIATQQFFN
jgi:NTE family protein